MIAPVRTADRWSMEVGNPEAPLSPISDATSEWTQPDHSTKPLGLVSALLAVLHEVLAASKESATPFVASSGMTLPCCLLSYPLTSRRK